jgi:hypothetical protein
MQDRFLKRLRKKAKKGLRGWPVATIAFYGPDLSRASKASVGIIAYDGAEPQMRSWLLEAGDVRRDPVITAEIVAHIEEHGAVSIVMADGIFGCPHQQGADYESEWCPVCEFWRGRDRYTGKLI